MRIHCPSCKPKASHMALDNNNHINMTVELACSRGRMGCKLAERRPLQDVKAGGERYVVERLVCKIEKMSSDIRYLSRRPSSRGLLT
jgi:hypothetical protein